VNIKKIAAYEEIGPEMSDICREMLGYWPTDSNRFILAGGTWETHLKVSTII
jgi:hypothetical protein